jgi:DNA-binding IclR family transcriptional regulator
MVKHTDRDQVWNCAMMFALESMNVEGKYIKVKYIRRQIHNPPSDRTIRDVLNTMTYQGWLQKEKKQSHKWYPGEALHELKFKEFEGAAIGSVQNIVGKPNED